MAVNNEMRFELRRICATCVCVCVSDGWGHFGRILFVTRIRM